MTSEQVIQIKKLHVDLANSQARINGKLLPLTPQEFRVLSFLATQKGASVSKDAILNHLYGGMDEPELKIIDVFICKLRKKLSAATGGDNYIETVWGRGYVLRDPQPEIDEQEPDPRISSGPAVMAPHQRAGQMTAPGQGRPSSENSYIAGTHT